MFAERRQFGRNLTNVNTLAPVGKAAAAAPGSFSVFTENASCSQGTANNWHAPVAPVANAFIEDDPMCIDDQMIEDIDELDQYDPQFVSEYINDIIAFLKEKEKMTKIPGNFLAEQKEISGKHRDILVQWMAKVYRDLNLLTETLCLAVDIVDRVLYKGPVTRRRLHLVGVGALVIASKYEETFAPPLDDFHICSDNQFKDADIIKMEKVLLNRIEFNLCVPSPLQFLRRYSKAARSDSETHTLSKYLTELSMTSHTLVGFLPSEIACAAVLVARNMKGVPADQLWNATIAHYSGYEQFEVMHCARTLNKLLYNEQMKKKKSAMFHKYSSSNLFAVALAPFRDL